MQENPAILKTPVSFPNPKWVDAPANATDKKQPNLYKNKPVS